MIKKDENEKNKEEFLKYVSEHQNGDCAADVFKNAKTPFERQLAIELFKNEKEHALIKKDMTHVKRLVWAIFAVVVISAVASFTSTYMFPLLGA